MSEKKPTVVPPLTHQAGECKLPLPRAAPGRVAFPHCQPVVACPAGCSAPVPAVAVVMDGS